VEEARRMIPSLKHDRPFAKPETATIKGAAAGE
jgi:hypothetical protein